MESESTARPTPEFARRAEQYLREGKTHEAMELCVAGIKAFPTYATGSLVLGRCYDAMGRKVEAMLEYRRALRMVPDNQTVQNLLRTAEDHEREEFEAFAESRTRDLKVRRDTMSFDQYATETGAGTESTVEFLLRQLQGVKRITPRDDEDSTGAPAVPVDMEPLPAGKIVTATLAEIYANQGQYREAVRAYRALVEQRPEDAERFGKRLAELEELARAQHLAEKA